MKKRVTGPFAVLMTPFCGERVDETAFAAQIERLNGTAVSGYVTNGSTGEFIRLSLEEQMALTALTAQKKAKDKKLIVSACTGALADTVRLCRHAGEVGADAVLVCPPHYFKYPASEREAYFKAVADQSPVPVVLYNVPFFTQELELDVIYRLFEHENIVGIKDSSANMKRLAHMADVVKDSDVSVMTGTDDILTSALAGGCVGSMTAFATIFPEEICGIYAAMAKGDLAAAGAIQSTLMPKLREADSLTFPLGYKLLMEKVSGIPFGEKEACV